MGICCHIINEYTIELSGAVFLYMPIYVSNHGKKDLFFDTAFGRYSIPPTGKLFRISTQAVTGRVAVYSDEGTWE